MNSNAAPQWTQNHDAGNFQGGGDMTDDFSTFLDFGDIPLTLPSPYDESGDQDSMDATYNLRDQGNAPSVTREEDPMNIDFSSLQRKVDEAIAAGNRGEMARPGAIPPTPRSMEMHGEKSYPALDNIDPQMMMDQFYRYREDPMVFTPLASPAVTPLEADIVRRVPGYAMPGSFSPLTSPALEAHQQRNVHAPYSVNNQTTPKPVDPSQSSALVRKGGGRRKSMTGRGSSRVVKESPSVRPQRKRPPPPTLSMPKIADALAQQVQTTPSSAPPTPWSSATRGPASREGSSNESVSPEPLPDVLMAPPPRKLSSTQNSTDNLKGNQGRNAPVTPASLMKLAPTSLPTEDMPPVMMDTSEFLNRVVDESGRPNEDQTTNADEMATPTLANGGRTPSLTPSARSSDSTRDSSRHQSPNETTTPNLRPAGSVNNTKKPDAGRQNPRKRGSVSSSPALKPKISPNIKPLLPMGMSADTSALLLASKSNYQNIVEGNHSHLGLQYPDHLSTNLTSKRTSHKIAEQGRRNRINSALAEMASLLPKASAAVGPQPTEKGREQTSKASTVELAIEYIRELQKELVETRQRLREAEEKLADGVVGAIEKRQETSQEKGEEKWKEKERGKEKGKEKEKEKEMKERGPEEAVGGKGDGEEV